MPEFYVIFPYLDSFFRLPSFFGLSNSQSLSSNYPKGCFIIYQAKVAMKARSREISLFPKYLVFRI